MNFSLNPKDAPPVYYYLAGFHILQKPHFYASTEKMYEVYDNEGTLQGTVMFNSLVKYLNLLRKQKEQK